MRRWAIIELFWPWGDSRYSHGYVEELCLLLGSPDTEHIGERFLRLIKGDVSPDRRADFVRNIVTYDKAGVTIDWLERARILGIIDHVPQVPEPSEKSDVTPPPIDRGAAQRETDELVMPGVFGRKESLDVLAAATESAKSRIARDDMESARSLLAGGLRSAQQGDWNVWNRLEQADEALKLVLTQTGSIGDGLRAISKSISEEEHASDWLIARKLMIVTMPLLDPNSRHDLFMIAAEHIDCLVRPERQCYSVEEEIAAIAVDAHDISANECVDRLLVSLLDHPNPHMRERTAIVLEWLLRQSEIDLSLVIGRIVSGMIGDGREIAIGIVHRLVLEDPNRREQILSSNEFGSLSADPSLLVRYLVEAVLHATWDRDVELPHETESESTASPLQWSFDTSRLLDKRSQPKAEWWANELCKPLSPDDVRALSNIRTEAFDGSRPRRGYPFEREAIFRAIGDVSSDSMHDLISASQWNPLWPDGQLRLDWTPLTANLLAHIESDELESLFEVGDQTLLHCFELTPPEGDGHSRTTEIVAVLVCKEFFDGDLEWSDLCEFRHVHDMRVSTAAASILVRPQEPAIARFPPGIRIGGYFTPAQLSRRMTELVGSAGVERVCWRNGRRWDLWGPGPVLASGTALLIKSSQLEQLSDYDLIWAIMQDEVPRYMVDRRRRRVYVYGVEDED